MTGFNEVNRFSYSGSDARAFAFYPSSFEDKTTPGVAKELKRLYLLKKTAIQNVIDSGKDKQSEIYLQNIEKQIAEKEAEIAKGLIFLESLATISYQVHEPKAPVRALGFRAPKGFARSVRTVAGTMIFIVIEDHPLRKLMDLEGTSHFDSSSSSYSLDLKTKGTGYIDKNGGITQDNTISVSTLLKPFNLLVQYSTEMRKGTEDGISYKPSPIASYMLENVEIISEGITTSVNDMVTEVVMQFQAHNVYQLTTKNSTVQSIVVDSINDISADRMQELKRKEQQRQSEEIWGPWKQQ
jgi:hypothetical protein